MQFRARNLLPCRRPKCSPRPTRARQACRSSTRIIPANRRSSAAACACTNWTNTGGNTWKTTLPASTQYFENLFYNGVRRLRPRLGGYLGAYYRNVGPVYLNAPAPPAQAAPNRELFGLFRRQRMGVLRPLPVQPVRPHREHLEKSRSAGGQPVRPTRRKSRAGTGDIELREFRAVHRFQTAHQLHGHHQSHRVPYRRHRVPKRTIPRLTASSPTTAI